MYGLRMLWSNAVISVAASACVLRSWSLLYGTQPAGFRPWIFAAGIGAATWLAYTWQRHVKSTRPDGLREEHSQWLQNHHTKLRWVGLLLAPAACIPLVQTIASAGDALPTAPVLFVGLLTAGLLTLLYAGLPGIGGVHLALRRWPRLKLMWIGLTWSIVTAVWPALLNTAASFANEDVFLMALERALVIMALTLPFDLRDRNWDAPAMKTLPQAWGTRGTRITAAAMLILAALVSTKAAHGNLVFGAGPLMMVPAVAFAHERRSAWYFVMLDAALVADAALVMTLV